MERTYTLHIGAVIVTVEAQTLDGTVLASHSLEAEVREDELTSATLELVPAPEIRPQLTLTATPTTVKIGEEITVAWNASDDDQVVRVEVDTNGDGVLESVALTGSLNVPMEDLGIITLQGEAEDNDGLIVQVSTSVEVLPRWGGLEVTIR